MDVVDRIEGLFAARGDSVYEGRREEAVTARAHALQCAQLAEWAHAPTPLVIAAFLHDIGHLVDVEPDGDDVDDRHEVRALWLLEADFGPEVCEPIRLHVAAKRYLCAVDGAYATALSPASIHSLHLQGGAMTREAIVGFEALPFAGHAVALRRWDDLAKTAGRRTPPLEYYLALVRQWLEDGRPAQRKTGIGAFDAT